jgi:threonine/homoserine/homoserine lactone efflux protein
MINLPLLLAFIAAASILTVTPGVDTAMVLRCAAVGGPRFGGAAAIGIVLGCFIWGASVSLGLGTLLQASELAYTVVKCAGAAYLIWLGTRMLWKPRQSLMVDRDAVHSFDTASALRRGFLTNILNPKIGMFYVTFLPQFIPHGAGVAGYSFFLASIHVALTLVWYAVLIAAMVPLGRFLRMPLVVKTMDRVAGGVFVAFGIKLVTSTASR